MRAKKEKKWIFYLLEIVLVLLLAVLIIEPVLLVLLIIYLSWKLFALVVNKTGAKGLRISNGKFETPVVLYEHPGTNRKVAFITTIHIAEPKYFVSLQNFIDSLSGYKILFEGVGQLSPQEEKILTKKERDASEQFDYVFDLIDKLSGIMSFQHQREGLTYDSAWINTDIRLYKIVQLFAQYNVCLIKRDDEFDKLAEDKSVQFIIECFVNKLFKQFVPITTLYDILPSFSRNNRLFEKIIITIRDKEAVIGIRKYLTEGNVATIWGAEHFHGIDQKLKQAGFHEIQRKWFTAYHIRKYSFIECLQNVISILKRHQTLFTG